MKKNYFCTTWVAVIASFAFCSCHPDGYVITGKINMGGMEGCTILLKTENQSISDSTIIKNGSFAFRGQTDGLLRGVLATGDKYIPFYLVNDHIYIELSPEHPDGEVRYKRSRAAEHIKTYFQENTTLFYEPYKQLLALEVKSVSEEGKNEIRQKKDSLVNAYIDSLSLKYEKYDNREGLSLIIKDLTGLFGTREHPGKIKELYALMPENEKNNYSDLQIQNYFDQSAHIISGQPVDFNFTDCNGSTGNVSDYKGKLVLIEFWATWCGPCLAQFPMIEKISARADKIKIITVSVNDDIDQWKARVPELDTSWVNIHYLQDINLKKRFFISGVPANLLLSPDGKILRTNINFTDITAMME